MIKIKHLMDAVENDDSSRLWIEPVGLTKDLQDWCKVDHLLCHLAPPEELWRWFEEHPDGYGFFRATYHEWLNKSKFRPALQELACAGLNQTFTLLHAEEDAEHNCATALYEYLSELGSYCPREPEA